MSSREIVYERNMTGSYMKIAAPVNVVMDEKLMLHRKLPGLLPVEKTYVDGRGQYWYNISGKQSLDCYCKVQEISMEFIERMIISICNEMEMLEWNLIQSSCLMLDPELVFITSSNREFIFTVYPENSISSEKAFQQLMEYLLTRIDHKDAEAVRASYGIYEKTLEEGFSIMEIRDCIADAKRKAPQQNIVAVPESLEDRQGVQNPSGISENTNLLVEKEPYPLQKQMKREEKEEQREKSGKKKTAKVRNGSTNFERLKEIVLEKLADYGIIRREGKRGKKKKAEQTIVPVYPEEMMKVEPVPVIHPTVCLATYQGKPQGMLLYQGNEQMDDIQLETEISRIGYGNQVEIRINKSTISQLHAKIDKAEDAYYIEDLNSTNGTYVNDELLAYKERRKLNLNDIISFADVRYRFT